MGRHLHLQASCRDRAKRRLRGRRAGLVGRHRALAAASAAAILACVAIAAPSVAAARTTVVPYGDADYHYLQVAPGHEPTGWQSPSFDYSGWAIDDAAFGSGGGCPLQATVKTRWDVDTDLLARKSVDLPAGTTDVTVAVAVDNDVSVYWNGTLVGSAAHDGCPSPDDYAFSVPDSFVVAGSNELEFEAVDRGFESFVDVTVTANVGNGAPGVLGLGDSIAAGYGLGPSGPSAGGQSVTNAFAYPAVLAGKLGLAHANMAVEGDNAVGVYQQICNSASGLVVDGSCEGATVPVTPPPRLITLTVGADDIDFSGCMIGFLKDGIRPENPCASNNLARRLSELRSNLTNDFRLLTAYYPDVQVILTGYFNPLGDHNVVPNTCPLVTAAVVGPWITHDSWQPLLKYVLSYVARSQIGNPQPPPQNEYTAALLSAFTRQAVTRLNNTLAGVAATLNPATGRPYALFIPLDLGSHGLCDASPLVFDPLFTGSVGLEGPGAGPPIPLDFGHQNPCQGPKDPVEARLTYGPAQGTISLIAGQVLTYKYFFTPNCVPHPTIAGQRVLADEVLAALP
jgi:lysophospholipase L1-like esterase